MNRQQDALHVRAVHHRLFRANDAEQARDRKRLEQALRNHVLTPSCRSCRKEFDALLAEWREKYA